MTTTEFLATKNIPANGMNAEMIEAIAKANGYVEQPKTSEIYSKYKSGLLTASGNSESFASESMFTKFGVKDAGELFDVLENKDIVCTLLEIGEVKGTELPKTALNGNDPKKSTGIKYRLECKVNVNGTSDANRLTEIVFNLKNKGTLVGKTAAHILDSSFGVIGTSFVAKIAKYTIEDRVILGLIP